MGSWHSQYKVPNPAKYYFSAGPCPPHTNCGGGPSTNKSGHYISVLGYNSGLEFPSGHLERGAAAGKLLDGPLVFSGGKQTHAWSELEKRVVLVLVIFSNYQL